MLFEVRGLQARRKATLLAGVALAAFVLGQSHNAASQTATKWGAHLDLEGKIGTERNLGEGGLFLPLYQTPDTLVFGDLRMRFDDNESHEANVGLGVRRMLGSGWNVGGYGYFDRRESPYDNYFNQITVGGEALGRDFDLRVNGYLAIGDKNRAVDSLSAAEMSGTSVSVRGGEERSMSGFDAEVGWRAPIFDAEAPRQLRLYAGGYRFTADGVDDVTGPRLRADMTFDELPFLWEGSRLSLGAEWQHDDPRGSQAFAGLRLRIPLQRDSAAPRLSAQERRMTDTVIRDIDVVIQAGAFGAPEAAQATNGGALAVINSTTVTGGNLQTAINNAGANSTIVLIGNFNTTVTMNLQPGQTMMGSGNLPVQTASGRTASLATPGASITTGVTGNVSTVEMANDSTIRGMTIVHTDPASGFSNPRGIRAFGVSNVTIANNTVNVDSTGASAFGIRVQDSTNVNVLNNNVTTTHSSSISFGIQVADAQVRVAGNIINSTSGNPASASVISLVDTGSGVEILSGSTGNVRVNGGNCDIGGSIVGTVSFTDEFTCP